MTITSAIRRAVWARAENACEYCHMPQAFDPATFEIDHVIPEKMRGDSTLTNLCLACFPCNNHKGPNIAGIDPATGERAFLFDPRKDLWSQHFQWQEATLVGKTPQGRATVDLLQINAGHRVAHRRQLIEEGVLPSSS